MSFSSQWVFSRAIMNLLATLWLFSGRLIIFLSAFVPCVALTTRVKGAPFTLQGNLVQLFLAVKNEAQWQTPGEAEIRSRSDDALYSFKGLRAAITELWRTREREERKEWRKGSEGEDQWTYLKLLQREFSSKVDHFYAKSSSASRVSFTKVRLMSFYTLRCIFIP